MPTIQENSRMSDSIVNIDDVFNTPIDYAEAQEIAKIAAESTGFQLLLDGHYYTLPPLDMAFQDSFGRPVAHYWGDVVAEEEGGMSGKVGFNLSPVKVITAKGRPDATTQLTVQAALVFEAVNGQQAETYAELFDFVRTTPLRLYVAKKAAGSFTKETGETINYKEKNVVYSLESIPE